MKTIPIQRSHNREHNPPLMRIPPLKKSLHDRKNAI
jgi:hypothetical protein